jgi:hypothetical protein
MPSTTCEGDQDEHGERSTRHLRQFYPEARSMMLRTTRDSTPAVAGIQRRRKGETMFKKVFELITLKWIWDRRGSRR